MKPRISRRTRTGIAFVMALLLCVSMSFAIDGLGGEAGAVEVSEHLFVEGTVIVPYLKITNLSGDGGVKVDVNQGEAGAGFSLLYVKTRDQVSPFDFDVGLCAHIGAPDGGPTNFALSVVLSTIKIKEFSLLQVGWGITVTGTNKFIDRQFFVLSIGLPPFYKRT